MCIRDSLSDRLNIIRPPVTRGCEYSLLDPEAIPKYFSRSLVGNLARFFSLSELFRDSVHWTMAPAMAVTPSTSSSMSCRSASGGQLRRGGPVRSRGPLKVLSGSAKESTSGSRRTTDYNNITTRSVSKQKIRCNKHKLLQLSLIHI